MGAVVVGVIPALQATGRRAQSGLQHAAASASRWKVGRTYGALIVVQVTLAVAILPVAIATVWQSVQAAGLTNVDRNVLDTWSISPSDPDVHAR